jgi:thiol-disulfide isomerase/thioredoxin
MHTIDDKEVHLADFKGKVVVLDFWATWCGPCISSFPHTQKLAAKYKDQDVVVLASGTSDTIAAFKKWIPANQTGMPTCISSSTRMSAAPRRSTSARRPAFTACRAFPRSL